MDQTIKIKGIREGLLISVGEGRWDETHSALINLLDEQGEFMKGARIALDVGPHELRATELSDLRSELSERQLSLWAVLSSSSQTKQTAQSFGLETRITKPENDAAVQLGDTSIQGGESAVLVNRTLRSGYSLSFPGHVTVIGDVNPGAEIIASGSIIVWGRLLGLVHAGAEGDEDVIVCALDLRPTQIRIAGQIADINSRGSRLKSQPEIVYKQEGKLIREPWKPKKGK